MNRSIKEDIAAYVKNGGRDAFAFSLIHTPKYGDVPGAEIQRMIDAELLKTKGDLIMAEKHDRGRLIEGGFEEYGTMDQLEKALLYQEIKEINEHEIILKNGVRITIECSESDCCAGGGGLFEYSDYEPPIDAVITDFKIHEPIEVPDGDTRVSRNTITIFHNQNPIVNANAECDAGNGGYYYSVVSLVIDEIHFPFVDA